MLYAVCCLDFIVSCSCTNVQEHEQYYQDMWTADG